MSHTRFCFLFILACIFSTTFLSASDTDKQGRQVRDEFGRRINYDRDGSRFIFVSDPESSLPADRQIRKDLFKASTSGKAHERDLPHSPSSFDPAMIHEQASTGSITQMLGTTGIYTVDVDNDAVPEILVGHTSMWYLLRYDPERNSFVQAHFHEAGTGCTFGCGDIKDLHYGDVDADGELEVIVLFVNDSISVYDARTGNLEGSQALGISNVQAVATGELDPTIGSEIAALTSSGVYVFSFGTTTPLWSNTSVGGVDMEIGNVDDDPSAEIVYTAGTSGALYAIDSTTHSIEYVYADGGDYVDVGDIDGDSRDEVVTVEVWGNYLAVDMETESQKWKFQNFNSSAITVGDINEDGIGEVLVGDAQWGSVKVLDGSTGTILKQVTNPEHSVSFIATGDVNGDCKTDVMWGAGYSSTGNDRLFIADPITATIFWQNIETDGPMHCFNVADIDADGKTELIWCSGYSNATYDGALVFITDLHHHYDKYIPTDTVNDGWMVTRGLLLLQADGDPQLEYVMNASTTYSGKVGAFDGVDHSNQWISSIFDGEYINALASGDVDSNGSIDVVVGTGREHTGAEGVFIRVLRLIDGAVLWKSPTLTNGWGPVEDVRVADIDSDGTTEILAATSGDGLRIFNGVSHAEEWFYSLANVTALETADVDSDGDLDILLGNSSGQMTALDGITHAVVFQTNVVSSAINAILVNDVDGDGTKEILFTYNAPGGPGSYLRIIKASDRSLLWESEILSGNAGDSSSLKVVDADDDGKKEILVSDEQTVRVYEYSSGGPDLLPPVFVGNPGIQSVEAATCCPRLDLDWSFANDNASPPVSYRVYRDVIPNFTPGPQNLIVQTGLTSYGDHNVTPGITYYYIVRAVDAVANEDTNTVSLSGTAVSSVSGTPTYLPEGTVNQPYNETINGNGGTAPYTFQISLGALPPGLSLSSDGTISGTPTTAGQYGVTIEISDSAGCQTNQGFVIKINALNCPVITISPSSLPDGTSGQAYNQQLSASGGTEPYTFALVAGTLPTGISLSSNGLISGTPVESGSFDFTVSAIDAITCSGSQSYTVNIVCPGITILPDSLPDGTVGTPYDVTLTATGGTAPYSFAVISGNLPVGLTLASNGNLSGTPSIDGTFSFTVSALDSTGCQTTHSYTITINSRNCPTIVVSPPTLPDGSVGTPYLQTITAAGGTAPYTFFVLSGSLPPGLSLSSDGTLSGTPTTGGNFTFVIQAVDSVFCTGVISYSIAIDGGCVPIILSPLALPDAILNQNYDQTVTASGGTAPYIYDIAAGTLPDGLTLSSTGTISGTPTTLQTNIFVVRATDSLGCTGSQTYEVEVLDDCMFCDDFEDGVLSPNWTYLKPSWSEAGGSLNGTPSGRKAIAIATPAFVGCSGCAIETVMRTAGGVGNRVWLLAWYVSKGNTIELLMKEETDRWILKQRLNGAVATKAKASQPIAPNTPYAVHLIYDGQNVIVSVDGTQILSVAITGTPNGTIGFQVKNTTAMFDYIQVN